MLSPLEKTSKSERVKDHAPNGFGYFSYFTDLRITLNSYYIAGIAPV